MIEALALAIGIVVGLWLVLIVGLVVIGRGPLAREIVVLIPNLTRLFAGLLRDRRVPRRTKVIIGVAIVYLASPLDLVPDFIPVVGALDDAIVAGLVLRYVLRTAPPAVVTDHWHGDPLTLRTLLRIARA